MDARETRQAKPADIDAVEDYHARCFNDTYATQLRAGDLEPPDRAGMRRQFGDWFRADSDVETQVVAVDGVPIAHFTISGNQLVHLFVDPEHQAKGLGRQLLTKAEAALADAGHERFELHARVENVAAIAFYQRSGWTVTDRVVRTVEHDIGYDELILVKYP